MDPVSPYVSPTQHHANHANHTNVETTNASYGPLRGTHARGIAPAKQATDSWTHVVEHETTWQQYGAGGNATTVSANGIPGWPRTPQILKRNPWLTTLSILGDLILFFTWMALAAFAIGIARSFGRSQADLMIGDELLSQAKIIVGLF